MSQNEPMRRAFLLSLLLTLFAAGCRPGQEVVRFPERPKYYRSIASLSPGATEIVASTSYQIPLVGRTAACNFPPSVSAAAIVAQVKPDYEKLKSRNPELVVYDSTLFNEQDIAQIKATGIDVFEFKARTIEEFVSEVRKLGTLLGTEMECSAYADKVLQERTAGIAQGPKPAPKVAFLMPGKGGEHYIAGIGSFQADLIRSGGGDPVGPESDRFVPINAESLIQLNPDMILTVGSPNEVVADPRLATLSAVKSGNLRGLNNDLATRMGYRVEKTIKLCASAINNMAGGGN